MGKEGSRARRPSVLTPQALTHLCVVSQETPTILAKGPGLGHGWGPMCQARPETRGLAGAALAGRGQGSGQRS